MAKWRKNCKKCGKEYVDIGFDTDKFCTECGLRLPKKTAKRCLNCKCILDDNEQYCGNCGKATKIIAKRAVNV